MTTEPTGAPDAGPGKADQAHKGGKILRWTLLGLALLAIILVPFLLFETQVSAGLAAVFEAVKAHPWAGAAVIIALLAGDCVLPVPSSLVSAFAGAAFSWPVGSAIIWTGMCLGCVAAYGLGASAGRILAQPVVGAKELDRAHRLFADVGPAALIVARAVPVLAEASALAAGAARMPFASFMLSTSIANAGVAIAYAAAGAAAASSGSFLFLFLGIATIPAMGWAAWRIFSRRLPFQE